MNPAMLRSPCTIVATVLLLSSALIRAQDNLRISCLPDRVVAFPGDAIRVNAWVASDIWSANRERHGALARERRPHRQPGRARSMVA